MLFRKMPCNRLAQFRDARDCGVMRRAFFQPLEAGGDNRGRSVEVRLADFHMDDASSLALQLIGPVEHLEGGFAGNTLHPPRRSLFCAGTTAFTPSKTFARILGSL